MYKISYEKCVCFVFLVILAILSCSGFHIDKMIPLPDHKKYLFSSFSYNESAYASDFMNSNGDADQRHLTEQARRFFHGGADERGVHRQPPPAVGALPLQELQRLYERRRRRRVRTTRVRTQEEQRSRRRKNNNNERGNDDTPSNTTNDHHRPAAITTTPHDRNPIPQRQPAEIIDTASVLRARRAGNKRRKEGRGNRPRFCPGQDIATRFYRAKIVLEGRIRSKTRNLSPRANYNVTYEVKRVWKDQSGFRPLVKNESIRLQFLNERSRTGSCEFKEVNGVVAAQFNISKNYVLFANRIGDHEYEILGPPLESNRKTRQDLKDIHHGKLKVQAVRIVSSFRNQTVRLGKKLRLKCETTGNPRPVIRWFKDGREIVQNNRNKNIQIEHRRKKTVLNITQVHLEDAGRYTCKASDVLGTTVNKSLEVTVVEPRPKPESGPEGSSPCKAEYQQFCMNGGTCFYFGTLSEYACKCPEGFGGLRCENKQVTNKSSMYGSVGSRISDCKLGLHTSYYC